MGIIDGAVFLLGNQCGVNHGLEIWKLQDDELSLDCLMHSVEKSFPFLLIRVDVFRGLAGKVVELGQVLAYS